MRPFRPYPIKLLYALSFVAIVLFTNSCKKDNEPEILTLGTEVCLVTLHHERGLSGIRVYVKYNATTFPGYDDLSVFDTSYVSDEFAEVCFPKVPIGQHWFVGFGVDDLLEEPVRGSVPMEIHNYAQPRDSVIFVTEY